MIRLLSGDCRTVLPTLPDASVQCVVTSPPYYGLRDYGTAQWEGGDAGCDHAQHTQHVEKAYPPATVRNATFRNNDGSYLNQKPPSRVCRCGARRIDAQIGLEATPEAFIAELVAVFREVRRVLRDDGTVWLNMGDSYASSGKSTPQDISERNAAYRNGNSHARWDLSVRAPTPAGLAAKQLLLMPARVALALQADGWWVRSEIVWAKPNPMPESCRDRPTSAHEKVYLLSKRSRYYYDSDAVREKVEEETRRTEGFRHTRYMNGRSFDNSNSFECHVAPEAPPSLAGRNLRNVWTIATAPFPAAHFATFPPELAERCIRAGTSERGCCAACGAPWVRVTDTAYLATDETRKHSRGKSGSGAFMASGAGNKSGGWNDYPNLAKQSTTTGWSPSCQCYEYTCPNRCAVLDSAYGKKASSSAVQYMQNVRRAIPPVEAQQHLLLPEVPRRPPEEVDSDTVPPMREGLHSAELPSETVFWPMRTSVVSGTSSIIEGLDYNQHGLQADLEKGPSEREQGWLRAGASACNGEEAGQASHQGRDRPPQERQQAGQSPSQPGADGKARARRITKADLHRDVPPLSERLSDERTCPDCGSFMERTTPPTAPCVVLDCFSGAGTALLVADRLGRDAIGIDLSHAYVGMARERLIADCPLFADISPPPAEDPEDARIADLFAIAAD
ncbi:MAG TPA: site-specific DNA-methyltransferase [Ktedonobacterales bacterium]|nr:site-specific DNA-methyltransferase [Ktedonobacterales bacterium]